MSDHLKLGGYPVGPEIPVLYPLAFTPKPVCHLHHLGTGPYKVADTAVVTTAVGRTAGDELGAPRPANLRPAERQPARPRPRLLKQARARLDISQPLNASV